MIPGFVEAVIAEESVVTDAGGGAVIQVELASARVSGADRLTLKSLHLG